MQEKSGRPRTSDKRPVAHCQLIVFPVPTHDSQRMGSAFEHFVQSPCTLNPFRDWLYFGKKKKSGTLTFLSAMLYYPPYTVRGFTAVNSFHLRVPTATPALRCLVTGPPLPSGISRCSAPRVRRAVLETVTKNGRIYAQCLQSPCSR